ncbi:MAG: type II toxin-antitoxin system VapC family toxin [Candidatus Aenigmarchaeota archaeon]|nr:type II toxin-antitoxin system VapC family toxin [Candidatus Aenigmarchaeota archaeon]
MICLDTTVVVDIFRGKEDLLPLLEKIRNEVHAVSSPSLMELWRGAFRSRYPEKEKHKVLELIDSIVVMPFETKSSLRAGEIEAELFNKGMIIDTEDIMTSAICIESQIPIVTRNVEHFSRIKGLEIISY